jgi:hypothetical protein
MPPPHRREMTIDRCHWGEKYETFFAQILKIELCMILHNQKRIHLKCGIDEAGVLLNDSFLSLQQTEQRVLCVEQHLPLLLILHNIRRQENFVKPIS